MDYIALIESELTPAQSTLKKFTDNKSNLEQIDKAAQSIAQRLNAGGKILTCGNGGSHCDAMHFAEELTGRYRENRKAIAAIAAQFTRKTTSNLFSGRDGKLTNARNQVKNASDFELITWLILMEQGAVHASG